MKRFLLPLLLTLLLALSLALASLWFTPQGQLLLPAWAAPDALAPDLPAPVAEAPPVQAAPLLDTINERPLYASLRRPPAPPKIEVPPPPDPIDQTFIQGILEGDLNIVLATVDGRPRRLQLKDRVGEWTLERVAARNAVFKRQGQERTIHLRYSPLRDNPPTTLAGAGAGPASGATAAGGSPASAATSTMAVSNGIDANRERLRRRNEIREKAGLPPLSSN